MTATKAQSQEARERLLECIGIMPGNTIHTVMRHRTQSGMTRWISPLLLVPRPNPRHESVAVYDLTYNVGRLLGWRANNRGHEGVEVGGCGMDMGFHLVYEMSSMLFPEGFGCIGVGCPSNDHINGDRNLEPHHHRDGGYALRHRWL